MIDVLWAILDLQGRWNTQDNKSSKQTLAGEIKTSKWPLGFWEPSGIDRKCLRKTSLFCRFRPVKVLFFYLPSGVAYIFININVLDFIALAFFKQSKKSIKISS